MNRWVRRPSAAPALAVAMATVVAAVAWGLAGVTGVPWATPGVPVLAPAARAAEAGGQERFTPNGVVALMTDYGERDFYVGAIKGVALETFPDVKLVDITHQVQPYNIHEGAVTLWLAAREFPAGTVFVGVVDPGVGTERRPIVVETRNGHVYVGPDNGLFTLVMQEFGVKSVRHIINRSYMRPGPVSYSFHGRDIFTPVAAHLAAGWPVEAVGPEIGDYVRLAVEPAQQTEEALTGQIIFIDQYGNLQANITGEMVRRWGLQIGDELVVQVGNTAIPSVWVHTYGDVPEGEDLVFLASTDLVEIAVNMGSAKERFGASLGAKVTITRRSGP
ncbi:MAG: S-adenosyl-l-methionine hydroxide adenosyltransferase family protein [Limnochordaceae bacterium]|nr:S-adenosyl-l-methionine hydroxide adenosyltransferase family protein [Limnochordaceae bacterium]